MKSMPSHLGIKLAGMDAHARNRSSRFLIFISNTWLLRIGWKGLHPKYVMSPLLRVPTSISEVSSVGRESRCINPN